MAFTARTAADLEVDGYAPISIGYANKLRLYGVPVRQSHEQRFTGSRFTPWVPVWAKLLIEDWPLDPTSTADYDHHTLKRLIRFLARSPEASTAVAQMYITLATLGGEQAVTAMLEEKEKSA